ncbi:nucleotidyltransferase, partial [Lactobacillus sp. XV13L]|nr:nucleotidyltransferase [Lactobacillus sp. XV13L]
AISWGVDRSVISEKFFPKMKNYGNSQILTRDYTVQREIEIVLREIGEQVGARIRAHKLQAGCISLYVGFSQYRSAGVRKGFSVQRKICPTNDSDLLVQEVLALFRTNWHGEAVRALGISCSRLAADNCEQLTLFVQPWRQLKKRTVTATVDKIRQKYGFTSVVKASSLLDGATAIRRANLVGGHNGGNAYE